MAEQIYRTPSGMAGQGSTSGGVGSGQTTSTWYVPSEQRGRQNFNPLPLSLQQMQSAIDAAKTQFDKIKAGGFTYSDQMAKALQNPKALSENYDAFVKSDQFGRPLTGAGNEFISPLEKAQPGTRAKAGYSQFDPSNSALIYGVSKGRNLGAINPETAYEQQAKELTGQRQAATKGRSQNVAQSFSTGITGGATGSGPQTGSANKYLRNILSSLGA